MMFKTLKWGWKALIIVISLGLFGWVFISGFYAVWNKVAFANPKVKTLVLSNERLDSLVFVQDIQLVTFNDEVNGYHLRILNDSIRHAKDIAIHQSNTKALLQKNKDLEKLLYQYEDLGPCRYPEDSTVGKWPNRNTVTIWRTKPCID